ncbi:hypothetical protein ADL30_34570 [Streptomyces sp. NRRL S-1521]|nr:hypothetical protein ADL30_34570 [Streptomyces sp. NRRL S-1521]
MLADPALLLVDVPAAGVGWQTWAVQIAVRDGTGRTVVNEILNPGEPITVTASRNRRVPEFWKDPRGEPVGLSEFRSL